MSQTKAQFIDGLISSEFDNINATGIITASSAVFSGNVSIGGTLTYEDVTNIDSVGLITARSGIHLGPTSNDIRLGTGATITSPSSDTIALLTNSSERVRITSSGNFGIGTASPSQRLNLNIGGDQTWLQIDKSRASDEAMLQLVHTATNRGSRIRYANADSSWTVGIDGSESFVFTSGEDSIGAGGTERARIDSSGRLLVGTSSARTNYNNSSAYGPILNLEGTSNSNRVLSFIHNDNSGGPLLVLGSTGGSSAGSNTLVAAQSTLGFLSFQGADGSELVEAANIKVQVDGTPGSNDMPGRLVFSTTADGASSPTERMRITSNGTVLIQMTAANSAISGCYFNASTAANFHQVLCHTSSTASLANLYLNRQSTDGTLIAFRQADVTEGSVSVSGTTVTYNGGHIGRWSQLLNSENPSNLLKGTVMSNLDEMCEWEGEDNEQLNKTKVSDLEGDPNVAGVFVSTSFSEDGPLDFIIGMTGDMVIRIAQGTTVARGDLLMSAGDGTAKPQDDDIIRSKTIAKVTSTNVSETYADGSYCVPCVLMAC